MIGSHSNRANEGFLEDNTQGQPPVQENLKFPKTVPYIELDPKDEKQYLRSIPNNHKIFINNIHRDVGYDEILYLMQKFGSLLRLKVPFHKTLSENLGFGYAVFQNITSVEKLMKLSAKIGFKDQMLIFEEYRDTPSKKEKKPREPTKSRYQEEDYTYLEHQASQLLKSNQRSYTQQGIFPNHSGILDSKVQNQQGHNVGRDNRRRYNQSNASKQALWCEEGQQEHHEKMYFDSKELSVKPTESKYYSMKGSKLWEENDKEGNQVYRIGELAGTLLKKKN